jgi:hypothetical protein
MTSTTWVGSIENIVNEFRTSHNITQKFSKIKFRKVKSMRIVNYPPILSLHLNRIGVYQGNLTKFDTNIEYPLTLSFGPNANYTLKAVITHLGGKDGGHYVAVHRFWAPLIDLDGTNYLRPDGRSFESLNWSFASDERDFSRDAGSDHKGIRGVQIQPLHIVL